MRTGKDIKYIFIHCSAGYGDLKALRKFWRSLGWSSDGYHKLIDLDGTKHNVVDFKYPSNGVKGYNWEAINLSYIGGVLRTNVRKASDTRTLDQKASLLYAIEEALQWIHATGGDVKKVKILGHRDISPDQNGNGKIESWERIKECPSFDAIPEYKHLLTQV